MIQGLKIYINVFSQKSISGEIQDHSHRELIEIYYFIDNANALMQQTY